MSQNFVSILNQTICEGQGRDSNQVDYPDLSIAALNYRNLNFSVNSEKMLEHTSIVINRYRNYPILGIDRNYHLLISKAKEEQTL